jgi:hypothetical protein
MPFFAIAKPNSFTLDDITLYWVTNTAVSSARLHWENNANNFNAVDISLHVCSQQRSNSGASCRPSSAWSGAET